MKSFQEGIQNVGNPDPAFLSFKEKDDRVAICLVKLNNFFKEININKSKSYVTGSVTLS
jgi:hypothetical protein